MSIALPVEHHGRMTEIRLEDVFVYKADVVDHIILGYHFCNSYGLTTDAVRDCLMDVCPSVSVLQISQQASELRALLGEPQQDSAISRESQAGMKVAMCRHCSEIYSWSREVRHCCLKNLIAQGPTAPDRDQKGSQCCATEGLRPFLSPLALLTLRHTHIIPAITAATAAAVTAACISCFYSTGRQCQHERQPLVLDRQESGDPEMRTLCKNFCRFCMCVIDCFCVRQCMSEGLRPLLLMNDESEPPRYPCTIDWELTPILRHMEQMSFNLTWRTYLMPILYIQLQPPIRLQVVLGSLMTTGAQEKLQ